MYNIEMSIFTMAFTVKADRDDFQGKLNSAVDKIITDNNLVSRVAPRLDARGNWMNLTGATEKGYEWFDPTTRDAVWASRLIVGFTDKAEAEIFHNALITQFGAKDPKYSNYVDSVGKTGAFNRDVMAVKEATDNVQVDVK